MCCNNSAVVKEIVNHPINTFLIEKFKMQKPIISGVGGIVFLHFLPISNSSHRPNYSNKFSMGIDKTFTTPSSANGGLHSRMKITKH